MSAFHISQVIHKRIEGGSLKVITVTDFVLTFEQKCTLVILASFGTLCQLAASDRGCSVALCSRSELGPELRRAPEEQLDISDISDRF